MSDQEPYCKDEMVIAGVAFKGFRTFALALIALFAYLLSVALGEPAQGALDLTLIAFGFFFAKTVK
jgi:hypothetical protein